MNLNTRRTNVPGRLLAVAAATFAYSMASHAAYVDPAERLSLEESAKRTGFVAVQVHVQSVGLERLARDPAAVQGEVKSRTDALAAELGSNALRAGKWSNGIGQVGIHVTQEGLKILQATQHAISFSRDESFDRRFGLDAPDGLGREIEKRLSRDKFVDLEITPNIDGIVIRTGRDGTRRHAITPAQLDEARKKSLSILQGIAAVNLDVDRASGAPRAPLGEMLDLPISARVNREGLLALLESADVRSVWPKGFVDNRPTYIDPDALSEANRSGSARVVITLKTTPLGRGLSKESRAANRQATRDDLSDVLASAGIRASTTVMPDLGVMAGTLTKQDLNKLQAKRDARILSIVLNKPLGEAMLATSTSTINVRKYWDNPGYAIRGKGQWIVVMDSGVDRNHPFFRGDDGTSRVKFEACFGTNSGGWTSRCPSQDASGDSPLGLAGAAAPVTNCSTLLSDCVHGTHVAGIAAGRWYQASDGIPPNAQGVAPDATIAAMNVFSFPPTPTARAKYFTEDLIKGMQAIVDNIGESTTSPFTVNMSLGGRHPLNGSFANAPCDNWPEYSGLVSALNILYQRGVPIIAATGNDYSLSGISAPACLSKVIKVASVLNDSSGTTKSKFANVANPANFPGETFWMAPGGGDLSEGTGISSAIPYTGYTTKYASLSGTSQAAPHIAGIYALVKGYLPSPPPGGTPFNWTVDNATAWLRENASLSVPVNPCVNWAGPPACPHSPFALNSLRLP